jgi:hypothetical protein
LFRNQGIIKALPSPSFHSQGVINDLHFPSSTLCQPTLSNGRSLVL